MATALIKGGLSRDLHGESAAVNAPDPSGRLKLQKIPAHGFARYLEHLGKPLCFQPPIGEGQQPENVIFAITRPHRAFLSGWSD
ncbi:hypothetical protein [Hyphomicrobium sp. CS1BSMeth3]|uniref:hypothetical protein n=1 Tax=Hyphomicrobium sp. CS1BSMeth3 TaxID=1892844 RepID=UPI001FCDCB64|nr:hypothetical protein [Hyphomicrobium sp. CS1BSMeth3]